MAITFSLDINFGPDETAARAACETVAATDPITVGAHAVSLHKPQLDLVRSTNGDQFWELSVLPAAVSWGGAADQGTPRLRLTAAEYTALGHALYDLLRGLTGYRAAQVGWDSTWRIDLAELRAEYTDEVTEAELSGLVLAEKALKDLRGPAYRPFAPGYVWAPYEGERASSLTAD